MTTKRKLIGRLVPCRCFRGEEEVISVLDYSHCSLQQVPKEIFSFERTLEELYLDANQIEELPKCLEMTTKRKLIGRLVPCRCFRGEEEVISVLDYSHCSLQQVPKEIFSFERTLEELYLDANQIEELPKQLFNCQALRKLSMPDNDLSSLPTTIASLVNLKELDISKNGIQDFPDNIKCCKCLTIIEASVNPIAKLPDGFTQLLNLMQLYLNDAFLEYLPANFGRLTKLRILELRENHLKTLPKSIHRLAQLERLDLGNNEFTDMPEVLEQIQNLKELWMDNNGLQTLPGSIGKLKQLTYLDMSKNRVETIDSEISGCEALEDLLLSSNMLQQLPDSIGMLKKLTTLKVDDNQLTALPNTIGRTEHICLIGSCKNVTVMSLRSNKLEFLPEEIGQMQKLRVLNLSDNRLRNLPLSFTKLKELAALWLSDNQSKALIPLQSEAHPETKLRVLTNYMFPQQPRNEEDYQSDSDSFNPTLWEEQRQQRMTVAFDFEDKKEEEENSGKVKVEINLKRYPTPYPEDLKNMVKSVQNLVGKTSHALTGDKRDSSTNMELQVKDKYEHKWPISTKEIALHRVVPKQQQPETLSLTASCFCLITPSQQSNVLDNGQEDVSPTSQWAPYSLGRRDIPPENVIKKLPDSLPNGLNYPQAGSHSHQVQTMMVSSTQNPQHRSARDQQYEGAINKISIQQYQSPLPIPISSTQSLSSPRGAQSGRCLIQTKGQKSMDGYQDQFCVRIEKNPGLGFSITGGISGQGNPFKPSDMAALIIDC
ncbi:UNVERIFIED_CONTAM: hypothetical protein FKN15_044976 [Acipenser sinensis]